MSRPIPEVRQDMLRLATEIANLTPETVYALKRGLASRLRRLADDTKRKPPISVAPRRIRPLSDDDKEAVRQAHRRDPTRSQLELARLFNTNPGRISEALNEGA